MPGPEVSDPNAYRNHLLSLVGDDDAAEVQASTPPALRDLVDRAGADLRARPEAGEWSVLECVGHIVDAELMSGARYRLIVAEDEPPLQPYDQDHWVDRLAHRQDDPAVLMGLFEGLRVANLDLWARSSDADRARIGMHEERGPETFDVTFRMLAGHDRLHLAQAESALAAVRSLPTSS